MGKTNRLSANERKLSMLIGEQRNLREKIAQAEKIIADLDNMKCRIAEIDEEIELGERWIKLDHPDWSGEHLRPKVPHVHDSPIRFGNGTKLALAIVRESYIPLTVREIVIEACRREGHTDVDSGTIDRLCRTVGNGLSAAKQRGVPIDHDGGYPARWLSTLENEVNLLPEPKRKTLTLNYDK
jgi:hypothetical protein